MPGLALVTGISLTMQRGGATDALLKLFGPDDNGFLFDNLSPSYKKNGFNILYKDQAGTPVSADGQSAALMLDRSKGLVLGEDISIGGNPFVADDWTLPTGVSVSAGQLVFSSASSGLGAYQQGTTLENNTFAIVQIDVAALSSGSFRVSLKDATLVAVPSGTGLKTIYVPVGTGVHDIFIVATGVTTGTINSITVQPLPGTRALQTTAASQATYDTDTTVPNLTFDGGDYYSTTLVPSAEMTLAACFNVSGAGTVVVGASDSSITSRTYLDLGTGGVADFRHCTGTACVGSTDLRNTNVVLLGRGGTDGVNLYANGVLITSQTLAGTPTTYPLMIGALNKAGTSTVPISGKLYRAFAINRRVSDDEVQIITKALAKGVVTL